MTSRKRKSIMAVVIGLILAWTAGPAFADGAAQVKTDKDVYSAGETIQVSFFNAPGYDRDWICIAPAGSPETTAGDYKYMPRGAGQGVLTFDSPGPGKYEVRAYYNYSRNGYLVAARSGFAVETAASASPPVKNAPTVKQEPQTAAEYATAGRTRINVAVFYFTPAGMDTVNYGTTVTNTLINSPQIQAAFTVLPRKDLEMFLAASNLVQSDDLDNMLGIGTTLGLNYVIAGSIVKKGTIIITKYKVAGMARRNIIAEKQFVSSGEADLVNNVAKMSAAVIDAIRRDAD